MKILLLAAAASWLGAIMAGKVAPTSPGTCRSEG